MSPEQLVAMWIGAACGLWSVPSLLMSGYMLRRNRLKLERELCEHYRKAKARQEEHEAFLRAVESGPEAP